MQKGEDKGMGRIASVVYIGVACGILAVILIFGPLLLKLEVDTEVDTSAQTSRPPWIHESTVEGITYTTGVCSFGDKQGSHEGINVCGEDKSNPNLCRCLPQ